MTGVFPFETQMRKGKSHLGYREVVLKEDCIMGKRGDACRGHEFHYSEIVKDSNELRVNSNELKENKSSDPLLVTRYSSLVTDFSRHSSLSFCYSLRDSSGQARQDEGYRIKRTLASYIHIHFGSNPCIADYFLNFIKER
jgi:cobyrinic acid a,c-diamide synthase